MRLSDRAIEMPRLVLLAAVLMCAAGIAAIVTMPKERTPRIKVPVILVAIPNPGASPTINETQIIRRIEKEAGNLRNLKGNGSIMAQAVHGAALMQFFFESTVDPRDAKRDVTDLINRVKGEFPPMAQSDPGPIVSDVAFDDFPIIQVFVAGGGDGLERRKIAERLEDLISEVPGVAAVDIFGGLEREVQIEVDPHVMTLYGFSYSDIATAVRDALRDAPAGELESGGGENRRVRTDTEPRNVDEIAAIPMGVRNDKPIVLGDVARVTLGHKPVKSIARYGGQDAVVLLVRAKTDIDVLAASNRIQKIVDDFVAAGQNRDTQIGTVRSQAREIGYMFGQLGSNAFYGTIMVILMLWLSFGWRNATLIAVSFPFCILGTAAALWLAKQIINPDLAINNMVMFAIIVVVGEVADGAIIVGENIYRHRELGRSAIEAAKHGLHEVSGPLLSAYLTTIAGFAPLFLVRGIMGDFLEVLPIVTILALIAAVVVAWFILPVMSCYLMRPPKKVTPPKLRDDGTPMSEEEIEIANAEALAAGSPLKRGYGRALEYAMHHRLLVLVLTLIMTATPVILYVSGAIGVEFFPDTDVPIIEVYFELPLGAAMEKRTVKVAEEIEAAVMRAVRPEEWYRPSPNAPRVKPVTTLGEPTALNIRLDGESSAGPEFGMVYLELELAENRERSVFEIHEAIKKELPPLPGVIVRIKSPKEGPPGGAPVVVRLLGQDDTTIEALTARALEMTELLRSIPGTRDVTSDARLRPEIVVTPDRDTASLFGVDAAQIASAVNYGLEGVKIEEVDFGADEAIDVRLRNLWSERDTLADLANLPIRSSTGKIVSVEQVARIDRRQQVNVLHRYDRRRCINVRAQLAEGYFADDIKAELVRLLRPELSAAQQRQLANSSDSRVISADDQVIIEFGGENEIRDEAIEDLKLAMAVAMGLMMIILVVQFNNFTQPLIVIFSVPLCLVGVAIGLMIWGVHFSVLSMIGIVALSGVVVDNAMIMVEFINKMREAGIPLEKAVIYAGQIRIRPLLLTTLTNIVGLLPVSLNWGGGGEIWQPLSVTIMFGLGFATVVQLFFVPLATYTLAEWTTRRRRDALADAAAPVPVPVAIETR